MATTNAPGQRAMFHTSALFRPNPTKPSRSSAKPPPTNTSTSDEHQH